ncbi:MAG: hypothetical protein NTV49_09810 [Kiritimatiellaeota bacterium]|nr:hypothetical protein [Kiritimatiellota bacterium]
MKKLLMGCAVAVLVLSASAVWANCGTCDKKAEGAACDAKAKMTCPCMCVQGLTLTDAQKAKVDALQANCKDGCPAGCCKKCMAEMKKILTDEQLKSFKQNCAACKKPGAGCPKAAPAAEAPK